MKTKNTAAKGVIASFVNPTASGAIEYFEKACLLWNDEGEITYFGGVPSLETLAGQRVLLRENFIVLPGLIDLHTHLPQYEFVAQGARALLPWLEKYTYPQEARFRESGVAEEQSRNFFKSCLSLGTTTVVAYLSPFFEAARIAFEEATKSKIRAYMGPALMDRNVPPDLQTTVNQTEKDSLFLIDKYHKKKNTEFVVTPRFAITCSEDLLKLSGRLSEEYKTLLQTHISENVDEVHETLRLFPTASSYAGVYEATGCLNERTLLGHGIHLSLEELKIIQEMKSVLVHCPSSNSFLGSGIMPYRRFKEQGLSMGLGTDVAGGYSLSLFDEMRTMVEVSKLRSSLLKEESTVSVENALCQATLLNARAIGRDDLGSFAIGKKADFIVVDNSLTNPLLNERNNYDALSETLQRMVYRSHPQMVNETFIAGEKVFAR